MPIVSAYYSTQYQDFDILRQADDSGLTKVFLIGNVHHPTYGYGSEEITVPSGTILQYVIAGDTITIGVPDGRIIQLTFKHVKRPHQVGSVEVW